MADIEVEGVDEQTDLLILDFLDDVETIKMLPYGKEIKAYRLKKNLYAIAVPQISQSL